MGNDEELMVLLPGVKVPRELMARIESLQSRLAERLSDVGIAVHRPDVHRLILEKGLAVLEAEQAAAA
jgi:hypothetical protein